VNSTTPLVYSCSGCSSAAQLANDIAIHLDREGFAEMSCIAGVGGGVKPLVRIARSGRPILAIDGCPLACVKACLAKCGVVPGEHLDLSRLNVTKCRHTDYPVEAMPRAIQEARAALARLNSCAAEEALPVAGTGRSCEL
jgi:uncharacterized metal-binding protein